MLDLFIGSMVAAIALFSLSILPKQTVSSTQLPFAVVMACLALLALGPAIFSLLPWLAQWYIGLLPTIFFVFLAGIWLYQETLISEPAWRWQTSTNKHLVGLPLAMVLSVMLILLPPDDFNQMLYSDEPVLSLFAIITSMYFFAMIMLWCCLSLIYTLAMIRRVQQYRKRLNNVFSHQQGKTLHWLNVFSVVTLCTWLYAMTVFLFEGQLATHGNLESGVFILLLMMVWLIAANGLLQRPGFEEIQSPENESTDIEPQLPDHNETKAYQRSALKDSDLVKIAEKLELSISADKVHLGSEINLVKLSKHIGVPTQYISQTLSQHLTTNFFDFINEARIDDAKILLSSTDQSVLDLALATGFNARSSFYKAFKQFTGVTPSQYRKQCHQEATM